MRDLCGKRSHLRRNSNFTESVINNKTSQLISIEEWHRLLKSLKVSIFFSRFPCFSCFSRFECEPFHHFHNCFVFFNLKTLVLNKIRFRYDVNKVKIEITKKCKFHKGAVVLFFLEIFCNMCIVQYLIISTHTTSRLQSIEQVFFSFLKDFFV